MGAVLHTGDVRAEPVFLDLIAKNPFLNRYLASSSSDILEAIYLDTASMLRVVDVPTKVCYAFIVGRVQLIPCDLAGGGGRSDRPNDTISITHALFCECVDLGI